MFFLGKINIFKFFYSKKYYQLAKAKRRGVKFAHSIRQLVVFTSSVRVLKFRNQMTLKIRQNIFWLKYFKLKFDQIPDGKC